MKDKIIKEVENISDEMIESIIKIVKINSVKSKKEENAPFGKGIKEALDETLKIARELGFNTKNIDNYIGYASYGESEDYICAIGHLDVVPVGIGWKNEPFSGHLENGVIYSRGILDNKGPILSNLFALYALKRLNLNFDKEIRIIFGCDEESGFEDLKYYLTKEKAPIMGFTPDCKYPVVYAERGRATIEIKCPNTRLNDFFELVNNYILNSKNNGEKFNIDVNDEEFGILECRNYSINYGEVLSLKFNVSYPACITCDEIIKRIKDTNKSFEVECLNNFNPVRFEKDCFLVDTLTKTYEMITGEDGSPVTTTGGTYAKLMPGIVPFGPSFPGQKGIGHEANEWMSVEDIISNAKIYALSLYYLAKGIELK